MIRGRCAHCHKEFYVKPLSDLWPGDFLADKCHNLISSGYIGAEYFINGYWIAVTDEDIKIISKYSAEGNWNWQVVVKTLSERKENILAGKIYLK